MKYIWEGNKKKWQAEHPEQFEYYNGLTIRRYDEVYLQMWRGKAVIPSANYRFHTAEKREAYIDEQKKRATAYLEMKAKRRAEDEMCRATFQNEINLGTILYSSWGYDQTNIDFYEVTEKKGQTVTIRELAQESRESGFMSEYVKPIPGKYIGAPMKKRIGSRGIAIKSYISAWIWDGSEKLATHYA